MINLSSGDIWLLCSRTKTPQTNLDLIWFKIIPPNTQYVIAAPGLATLNCILHYYYSSLSFCASPLYPAVQNLPPPPTSSHLLFIVLTSVLFHSIYRTFISLAFHFLSSLKIPFLSVITCAKQRLQGYKGSQCIHQLPILRLQEIAAKVTKA